MKRAFLLTAAAAVLGVPAGAQTVAITGGTVAIGDGSAPIEGGTVVVRDGRVVAAGRGAAERAGAGSSNILGSSDSGESCAACSPAATSSSPAM